MIVDFPRLASRVTSRKKKNRAPGKAGLELHRQRVREMEGLISKRIPTRTPNVNDVRKARDAHAALFGKFVRVSYDERRIVDGHPATVHISKKIFAPGLMTYDARDPKVRAEKYMVRSLAKKKPKIRKQFQQSVGQTKIHPYFSAVVQKRLKIDGNDVGEKFIRLRSGMVLAVQGFVVSVVVEPDDGYIPSEDDEDAGFEELYQRAEAVGEEIKDYLLREYPYVGPILMQLMAGPNPYRSSESDYDELLGLHQKFSRKYNDRPAKEDNYDKWFGGIMVSVPYGYSDHQRRSGVSQTESERRRQQRLRRRRRGDRKHRDD